MWIDNLTLFNLVQLIDTIHKKYHFFVADISTLLKNFKTFINFKSFDGITSFNIIDIQDWICII